MVHVVVISCKRYDNFKISNTSYFSRTGTTTTNLSRRNKHYSHQSVFDICEFLRRLPFVNGMKEKKMFIWSVVQFIKLY